MKFLVTTALMITFALLFAFQGYSQTPSASTKFEASTIYEKSIPSVVFIMVANISGGISQGSGVILRSDGVIATNYHVIAGAKSGRVKLQNGDIYDDVSIVDIDERKDIAIIKIKAVNLPYLKSIDSDLLKIGANVYTIGAPRGLEGSISSGIISSIRQASEVSSKLTGFRVIQFTAPISSGSSGSPLLNDSGEVIGLAFASRVDGQSLNLAIPINYIIPLVTNAKNEGQTLAKMSDIQTLEQPRPTGTSEDVAGTYTGGWASEVGEWGGALVLTIKFSNSVADVRAIFTGSDYFSEDILETKFTSVGANIWKMSYKGKKSKISGTGIFKDGKFVGDYRFRKFIWVDTGRWILTKTE